jgi:general secretion pathway protein G
MNNVITGLGQGSGKVRFLRRIPKDPFTGDTDWGKRSMQDDPTSSSWGGQNVFDVYSKTNDRAPDGTAYAEW